MHNSHFVKMLSEMPDGIDRRVLGVLVRHIGKENRIKRDRLVLAVFGHSDNKPRQNSTFDRQVRLSIAKLQQDGIPVLSDSGEGGYWLGTRQECVNYIREQRSRQTALAMKINGLQRLWNIDNQEVQPILFDLSAFDRQVARHE